MTFVPGWDSARRWDPVKPPKVSVVRIVCISDTHTQASHVTIPVCDILIHAGDITYRGEQDKLQAFNDWGGKLHLPKERKICIAGNHDISFRTEPEAARSTLTHWTYLEDSVTEVCGLKIYGTPWSPNFYPESWVFNQSRGAEAAARWSQIPEDTDILVVHGPPFGYGDRLNHDRASRTRPHVGCVDLLHRLEKVRPKLTVCGHVHEDRGVFAAPWGTVVNACVMTSEYKPKGKPIIIDLPVIMS